MKANTEKFDALVSNKTSGWHKDVNERISNKAWQDKAFDFALKVIRHMRENKISQVRLADDMGMKAQSLNRILQGKENLTLETICRFESALNITLIEVIYSSTEAYEPEVVKSVTPNQFVAQSVAKESVDLDSIGYEKLAA
jgi:transcriptional regulator with XRE-family HTH domain